MQLTNITLKKLVDNPTVSKPGEKVPPTHAIIGADDNFQNKTTIGKLWMRESEFGKYLSGGLNKENRKYQKKDGTEGVEKAYVIITRDEYNKLTSPSVKVGGYEGEVATGEVSLDELEF